MTTLLAIDPGVDTGWARFQDPGDGTRGGYRLEICGLGRPPMSAGRSEETSVIIEKPQVYSVRKSKGVDPNNLITLAVQVGNYQERAAWCKCRSCVLVLPHEWKGDLPKPVHERRIRAKLTADETRVLDFALTQVAKSKQHNVIDAVGLGLYLAGRKA